MKNKRLLRKENEFVRVLKTNAERLLVIDCVKKTMPRWVGQGRLETVKKSIIKSKEIIIYNYSNLILIYPVKNIWKGRYFFIMDNKEKGGF